MLIRFPPVTVSSQLLSGLAFSIVLQTITWQPLSRTPPPSKLKQLARDGIPLSLRPTLWYQLSGAAALKRTEPAEYYTSLASLGKLSDQDGPELSLELFRTFSTHPVLSSYKALEAVRRIVTAFGKRNQSASYSQNVNFVVAFLLVVMGLSKEEEVFWVLTALLERRLPATSVVEVNSPSQQFLCLPLSACDMQLHIRIFAVPYLVCLDSMLIMCR